MFVYWTLLRKHWFCTYLKVATSRNNKESTFGLPEDIHTYLQQNRKCNSKYGGRIIIQQAVTTTSRINLHTTLPHHSYNYACNPSHSRQYEEQRNKEMSVQKKKTGTTSNVHLTYVRTQPPSLEARNMDDCLLVIPTFHGPTVVCVNTQKICPYFEFFA